MNGVNQRPPAKPGPFGRIALEVYLRREKKNLRAKNNAIRTEKS
jgi:hypothetical protein